MAGWPIPAGDHPGKGRISYINAAFRSEISASTASKLYPRKWTDLDYVIERNPEKWTETIRRRAAESQRVDTCFYGAVWESLIMDIHFTQAETNPGKWTQVLRIGFEKGHEMFTQWGLMYNQFNKLGGIPVSANRREFTEEERAILKENPYTYRVFKNSIRFTIEFKETFMRQYEAGMPPIKIVESLGYDADMLGKRCINSLYRNLKKQQASPEGLHEGSLRSKKIRPGPVDYESVPPKQALQLMQHELLYLRQEVEFLKKL